MELSVRARRILEDWHCFCPKCAEIRHVLEQVAASSIVQVFGYEQKKVS